MLASCTFDGAKVWRKGYLVQLVGLFLCCPFSSKNGKIPAGVCQAEKGNSAKVPRGQLIFCGCSGDSN